MLSTQAAPLLASQSIALSIILLSFGGLPVLARGIRSLILSHWVSVSSYRLAAIRSPLCFFFYSTAFLEFCVLYMRFALQIGGPNKNKAENSLILTWQNSTIHGCVYVLNVISFILRKWKRFQFQYFTENQVFRCILGRMGRKTTAAFFCFQP